MKIQYYLNKIVADFNMKVVEIANRADVPVRSLRNLLNGKSTKLSIQHEIKIIRFYFTLAQTINNPHEART